MCNVSNGQFSDCSKFSNLEATWCNNNFLTVLPRIWRQKLWKIPHKQQVEKCLGLGLTYSATLFLVSSSPCNSFIAASTPQREDRTKFNFSRFCKLIFRTLKRNISRIVCLDVFGHHQNIVFKVDIFDISIWTYPSMVYTPC